MGDIPNVSLIPGRDCGADVPCAHRGACYAIKFMMFPAPREAWTTNSRTAHDNPAEYFQRVRGYLAYNRPPFFRWHVAGDFLSQSYLDEVKAIAREFPETKFLAFTKRHDFDYRRKPSNLAIVFSMWPGWTPAGGLAKIRKKGLPVAWLQDGKEERVPKTAIPCPGICEKCAMCWSLPQLGRDVVFHKK